MAVPQDVIWACFRLVGVQAQDTQHRALNALLAGQNYVYDVLQLLRYY